MDPTDAINRAFSLFRDAAHTQLKKLLEDKHLYQNVKIDLEAIEAETIGRTFPDRQEGMKRLLEMYVASRWTLQQPRMPDVPPIGSFPSGEHVPEITLPTIKAFCGVCDRTEPYNLVSAKDLTTSLSSTVNLTAKGTLQVFVVAYVCQSCKSAPEFLMIRREGIKLSLVGRTPMGHVETPSCIPASHKKFYVGAAVASRAGQILPALFMLRTFIEQFAASQVNVAGLRADEILDRYMAMLPTPVRAHFASPREIYARLSDAIHQAREDSGLYESAIAQITEHFDARRLYKA